MYADKNLFLEMFKTIILKHGNNNADDDLFIYIWDSKKSM
jgi:hypothetical protein